MRTGTERFSAVVIDMMDLENSELDLWRIGFVFSGDYDVAKGPLIWSFSSLDGCDSSNYSISS